MLKEKAAYAITSRDQFGGGTEKNKLFDCEMFPLDFQKKQRFPSKHKANTIVSLLRSTNLLTTLLLQSNNLVVLFLSVSLTLLVKSTADSFHFFTTLIQCLPTAAAQEAGCRGGTASPKAPEHPASAFLPTPRYPTSPWLRLAGTSLHAAVVLRSELCLSYHQFFCFSPLLPFAR